MQPTEIVSLSAGLATDFQCHGNRICTSFGLATVDALPAVRWRVFPGHRWDDVIVVPFYDLPGRIIGFTFVGRGGDPNAGDFVYKRANIGYCGQRPKESGLGMMPALGSRPHHIFGNVAFVLTDAKAAIILHSSHLRDSRKPLPVVLVKSTRDLDVLTLPPDVAGRQLIFCGPLMKVLPLAHIHNGQVCDHSFTDFEFDRKIRHSPAGYLHDFRNRAVLWISALRQHLPKLARGEAEILISRLKLTPKESRALTQGLGGEVSERFAELEPYRLNRTLIGGQVVTETPEGWTVQRKNGTETICNYPIRVDNMLVTDDGQSYYEISVKLPEHSVDLVIAEQEVRRSSLFDAVFRELKAKTGEHLQFQRRRWAKESLFIAMQFSSPETIKRIGRVGWWQDRSRFQFPHFAILNNGDVEYAPMPVHGQHEPPASHLSAVSSSRDSVLRLSGDSPEVRIIWALAACFVHNLLAGNCLQEPLGIVLDGEFAHETGKAAALTLGCGQAEVGHRGNLTILEHISLRCGAHDFPTLVRFGARSRHRIQAHWLDDRNLRHSILPLNPAAAIGVSTHRGFVRLRIDDYPQPLDLLSSAAAWIIVAYLRDLCRRKKQIDVWSRDHQLLCVLGDMAEWFTRQGGNGQTVSDAEQAIFLDFMSPGRAFAELALRLYEEGRIAGVRAGAEATLRNKTPIAVTECSTTALRAECVAVYPRVINQALIGMRGPAINLTDVRTDLEAQSALLEAGGHEQGELWLIETGWWQVTLDRIRRREMANA